LARRLQEESGSSESDSAESDSSSLARRLLSSSDSGSSDESIDAPAEYAIALVWSCTDFGNGIVEESLFVLSRTPEIDEETYESLLDYADSVGISVNDLVMLRTKQLPECDI
jgi:hypothetical protein